MSRPRQIDDQADVLDNPTAHSPSRPGWTCNVDGQGWPCAPLRAHLLDTMTAQEIGIAMDGHFRFAVIELDAPAADVHRRFFGWIRAR